MAERLLSHYATIHWLTVLGLIAGILALESLWPSAQLRHPLRPRWQVNVGLLIVNEVFLRLAVPVAAAVLIARMGWGLLAMVPLGGAVAFVITWLAIDLGLYAAHRLAHVAPALWRIHRVHHTDADVDVTTGFRFHPVEASLQSLVVIAVATLLGSPPLAVATYSLLMAIVGVVSHANIRVPRPLDLALRWLVITPGMHRIHHSVHAADYDSNFSVALSCWDRLLGTYRAEASAGTVEFGLEPQDPQRDQHLVPLLLDPIAPRVARKAW
ncbi:MAG: sterol desaturase family protein [Chromatiales bacterium]|nr:sterol desaturase family protein [Chromatiales bacterium]